MSYSSTVKMPNFFVVGAPKSATSSLYDILNQHPQIYCPPLKEPGFFADDNASLVYDPFSCGRQLNVTAYVRGQMSQYEQLAFIKEMDLYLCLYRKAQNEKAIGDFSTIYLSSTSAAKKIYNFNKDSHIIMILRDPAARALSHYKMDRLQKLVSRPFSEVIEEELDAMQSTNKRAHWYVRLGLYADQVERYLETFPSNQIKVILFEDFAANSDQVVAEIEKYLDLSTSINHCGIIINERFINKARQARSHVLLNVVEMTGLRPFIRRACPRWMINWGRDILFRPSPVTEIDERNLAAIRKICAPDVERLAALLGRDLSQWLPKSV